MKYIFVYLITQVFCPSLTRNYQKKGTIITANIRHGSGSHNLYLKVSRFRRLNQSLRISQATSALAMTMFAQIAENHCLSSVTQKTCWNERNIHKQRTSTASTGQFILRAGSALSPMLRTSTPKVL